MINRRLALSVSLCAGLIGGCASSASPRASIAPTALLTSVASPSVPASPSLSTLPSEVDIEVAGALTIEATPSIDWVVVVDGRAWIAGLGAGIGVLDGSGTLQQSIEATGVCESMDTGYGAVWSASCNPAGIIRIDAETGTVRRAEFERRIVDSEASVGVGEGGVWVVAGAASDVLIEIDPETLRSSISTRSRQGAPVSAPGFAVSGLRGRRPTNSYTLTHRPARSSRRSPLDGGRGSWLSARAACGS